MQEKLDDLRLFLSVAERRSFTRVAAETGVSRAAVSYCIGSLESRLGVKLFHRTTRSVSVTEAGENLYRELQPLFADIDMRLGEMLSAQQQMRGTLRVNGTPHAIGCTLWRKFMDFSRKYPDIKLELAAEIRFVDIVAERFDAGIRAGDMLNNDMIAVRVSDDVQMGCAASPAYLARHGVPHTPDDLMRHACVHLRLPTHGGLLDWEFTAPAEGVGKSKGRKGKREDQGGNEGERSGDANRQKAGAPNVGESARQDRIAVERRAARKANRDLRVSVNGNLIVNTVDLVVQAALSDAGVIWLEQDLLAPHLESGRLQMVLPDWSRVYPPYYLYYPNRKARQPLLKALVDVLREPV